MSAPLKAGRELDALVAEKVMGFWDVQMYEGKLVHGENNTNGWPMQTPCYSTEIAAAWEVVEKVGRATEIRWHPKAEQRVVVMIGVYDTPGGVAEAETLPLAICLAALEAVRARPTEQETEI